MGEREIKGTVQEWDKIETGTKADGSLWHKVKVKLAGQAGNFTFFSGSVEEAHNLITKTPPGTIISFMQWQREDSPYWNFKKETFKIIGKGAVPPPAPAYKPSYAPKPAQGKAFVPNSYNEQRDPGMNARTALMQAREMVCYNKIPADKLQETAEMYKLWLDSGMWAQNTPIQEKEEEDREGDHMDEHDNEAIAEEQALM